MPSPYTGRPRMVLKPDEAAMLMRQVGRATLDPAPRGGDHAKDCRAA